MRANLVFLNPAVRAGIGPGRIDNRGRKPYHALSAAPDDPAKVYIAGFPSPAHMRQGLENLPFYD
jgi:hypothetical protein